jgi:ribosomal protein S18 acetylase RimI-like enzyme
MIQVRGMTFEDLSLGLRLRQQAGWNQTAADWARFLSLQPDGCFVAEIDGIAAGTVTNCVFGSVAWIGMMLVDASRRGRGIGRALMTRALAFLGERGVRSVRLDATPLGEPLYRSLGFVEQSRLGRWEGELSGGEVAQGVEAGQVEDRGGILRLDREVTGTDRRRLLLELFREYPHELRVVRRGGAVVGYLTARRGARALFLGPCLATAEAGPLLLADAWQRHAGKEVILDSPAGSAAAAWVRQRGLCEQRQLLRMCRGEVVEECVPQLWASSGPEKG